MKEKRNMRQEQEIRKKFDENSTNDIDKHGIASQHKSSKGEKQATSPFSNELLSLDRKYLYQNPNSGAISSTVLTVRQLCRMFCPPTSSISPPGQQQGQIAAAAPSSSRFHPDTQLLALMEDGKTYDPQGWKSAKEIPILKHAVCSAFYYTTPNKDNNGNGNGNGSNNSNIDSTTKGPVSCRQLSELLFQGGSNDVIYDNDEKRAKVMLDLEKIQIFGDSTGNQWTVVRSMPDLEMALNAFQVVDQATHASSMIINSNAATLSSLELQSRLPQDYDVSVMIFDDSQNNDGGQNESKNKDNEQQENNVKDELEAFLSSTDHMGPKGFASGQTNNNDGENDSDDDSVEGYESDGGTRYVKDPRTENWIHEALAPPRTKSAKRGSKQLPSGSNKKVKTQQPNSNTNAAAAAATTKKKSKRSKFSAKHAKCWIYITGLPPNTNEEEVAKFFSKVGIIDLDPETQRPKVKLYRHKTDTVDETTGTKIRAGTCKGDASIGYARPESVELALQVLDEAPFRDTVLVGKKNNSNQYKVHVERAKFEQHGDYAQQKDKRKRTSQAQRKVAKLAAKQAIDWDDGEFNGRLTGGIKGLRIIVLKGMFHPNDLTAAGGQDDDEDKLLAELETKIRTPCEEHGTLEKITVFSKNPQGVVVVKFAQPGAASEALKAWDGHLFTFGKQRRKVQATFWDGVEDFTVRDTEKEEEEMQKRHDEFGAWLESQAKDELPEELQLKVEE